MEKAKNRLIKLLIVIFCFLCTDGSRSLIFISSNFQVILFHNHTRDIEIPHQHNIINFNEDEKLFESSGYDSSYFVPRLVKYLFDVPAPIVDFSDSIWQPPKHV